MRLDWLSAVPLLMTAALLLASPKSAIKLARGGFGAHLLDLKSIRKIESEEFSLSASPCHMRSRVTLEW